MTNGVYNDSGARAEAQFDWSVSSASKEGDTFSITLPNELVTVGTGELRLLDEGGNHVATANIEAGKKEVVFTLTDYVDTHFSVKGQAYFTVEWDRNAPGLSTDGFGSNEQPGSLNFSGCGSGTLLGVYPPDGPGGVTHINSKNGNYYGESIQVDGKTAHLVTWNIAVASDSGTNDFTVTDTAPEGYKFACSGKYSNGYAPVVVDAVRTEGVIPDRHYVVDGAGRTASGSSNLTDVTSEVVPFGYGYEINCTEKELSVRFPYGVDPSTGPRITVTTFTDTLPQPGSKVVNTANVNGKTVSGEVVIPSAGGWGEGKLGGFALRKIATGIGSNPDKQYNFEWKCTHATKPEKKGTKTLKTGEDFHIADVEKGYTCEISEQDASVTGQNLSTTWLVDGKEAEAPVKFDVREQGTEAVIIDVKNAYTPKPEVGGFKIVKTVKGLPADAPAKDYSFSYECAKNGAEVKTGTATISGAGATEIKDIPADAQCTVTEDAKSAAVPGYSLVIDSLKPVTITADTTQVVEVNNIYTKQTGSFSIEKQLIDKDGVAAGKKFTFDYTCKNDALNETKAGTVGPIGAGETGTVTDIAAGSVCTFTEQNADIEGADLKTSGLDSVTIVDNGTSKVTVTNEYSAWLASLKVNKEITGSNVKTLQDKLFEVNYKCTLDDYSKKGTVQVSANQPALIEGIRSGATCVLEENTDKAKFDGYNFEVDKSTVTVNPKIGGKDTVATATLKNHYSVPPTPTETVTPTPTETTTSSVPPVTVTTTTTRPGGIPIIVPIVPGSSSSGSSDRGLSSGGNSSTVVKPTTSMPQPPTGHKEAPRSGKQLAQTGAQVGGVIAFGAVILLVGLALVKRGRQQ
ncbi:peptidase [Corynebacterium hindlerae]|uniref:DUF5979 domain-containing protein n=1 Tax=Corynebacterium hindlerae TaxID=699041 RepID=UPI001AD6DBC0|nr:DUF5979 domain-containing protein [Corynebacterium hindlerae]QTH59772.1 peptidase [Corynebacterium hindlerae]